MLGFVFGAFVATALFTYKPELAIRASSALRSGVEWVKLKLAR